MVVLLFNLLNKVKKLLTFGTSPPSAPEKGSIWTDASTSPPTLKVHDGSSHVGVSVQNADTVGGKHASDFLPVSTDSAINAFISGNQWFSVATSGIVSLPKQSFCFMHQNTQQTVPSNTDTKVVLDAIDVDIQNEGDTANYRITVSETGVYLIIGQVGWYASDVEAGYNIATVIRVNNSIVVWKAIPMAITDVGINNNVAVIKHLTIGDYVELWARQYTNSDMRTVAALAHTFLCVAKIA